MKKLVVLVACLAVLQATATAANLPLVHRDDFEKGANAWLPSDAKMWTVDKQDDGNFVYHLHGKSNYQPPHRSPHSISLLKDKVLGDFVLTARVKTLQTTRGHRDMCIFFGFQDPAHFYYVHLGEVPDPHSSQIFIVNDAPRTKITETPDVSVPWRDDAWHQVKVVRSVKDGLIAVYFDDMDNPQKVAHDKTFAWGAIGLGSFDDLGLWDDVEIRGVMADRQVDQSFKSVPPAKPAPKTKGKTKAKAKKSVAAPKQHGPVVSRLKDHEYIAEIIASKIQDGLSPGNVADRDPKTKWAALGKGEYLQLEFKEERQIDGLDIGFVSGNRRYAFELRGATDRVNWKTLGTFSSPGKGDAVATYSFAPQRVRHLRVIVNGSNENDWANIHTVALAGTASKQKAAISVQVSTESARLAEQAKTLKFVKWSGVLNVPDPVALSHDNLGRVYATQTQRRKANDLDIRANRDWVPDDVGFQSVAEKRAHYHKHLSPLRSEENEKRVEDLNKDGSHDWRDLTVLTERIHLLEDTNGDGFADHIQVYAEDFSTEVTGIAAGVLWHEGDVYSTIAPDVWRLRDTDGNGKADKREIIATGFGLHIAYGGHDMHGLRVGPDGKIYWTIGDKGISVTTKDGRKFHYPNQGGMMRCEPDGTDFEVFAHGLRNVQEPAFDEFGNWFGVDNDSDQPGEKERFVYIVEGMDAGWRCNYQYRGSGYNPWMAEGLSIPWHEGQPAYITPAISNYEDGPAGFVYNPGTALSLAYRKYFFLTEAPRGIQWAFQTKPKGASFEMINSHQIGNGIALVGLSFGPDGGLYGVDWGGGYPLNQKGAVWKIDDPESGNDPAREEVKELLARGFSRTDTDGLIKSLEHADQRVRLGAQFELVKRTSAKALKDALAADSQLQRIHAVWGLGQLARKAVPLAKSTLINLLTDPDDEIKTQAVKMLGDLKPGAFDGKRVVGLLMSKNPRVQFYAAITAGKHRVATAAGPLIAIADKLKIDDTYMRHAVAFGLAGCATPEQLVELYDHDYEVVRVCAIVALRMQKHPGVAKFLNDLTDWGATEAARAIHDDFSIPDALPELAETLGHRSYPYKNEGFLRRGINANFRLGSVENAVRVARYAVREDQPKAMRLEALDALRDWVEPPLLDRVDGRRRDLGRRESKPIATAIAEEISQLVVSGDNALIEKAVELSTRIDIQLDGRALFNLLENEKAPNSLRVVAVNNLKTTKAVHYALKSRVPELRIAGAQLLAKTDKEQAVTYLAEKLDKLKGIPERQAAFATLALIGSKTADGIISDWAKQVSQGKAVAALKLDIIEAAEKRGLTNQLAGYYAKRHPTNYVTHFTECLDGGNSREGKEVFDTHITAQCVRCHQVGKQKGGSIIGPNLTGIGKKGREYLLQSLIGPNSLVAPGYGTMNVTLKDGEVVGGQLRKETKTEIHLVQPDGKTLKVKRSDAVARTPVVSIMPPVGSLLTRQEIRSLVEYLLQL